jgi:hypothetical protein
MMNPKDCVCVAIERSDQLFQVKYFKLLLRPTSTTTILLALVVESRLRG